MPSAAGRKGGRAPRKKTRSALLPTDENRVPLRCNQAFVISGTGNRGTQIVNTASTETAEQRAPLSGVDNTTPVASFTSSSSSAYHSLSPVPPYPPHHVPTYQYSPWFYPPHHRCRHSMAHCLPSYHHFPIHMLTTMEHLGHPKVRTHSCCV